MEITMLLSRRDFLVLMLLQTLCATSSCEYLLDVDDNLQASAVDSIAKWLSASKTVPTSHQKLPSDLQSVEFENLPVREINGKDTISQSSLAEDPYRASSCHLVRIVHLLHQDGCQPKAIASFACSGSCPSYVQTSSSKFWQHERSCSCCQQASLQEATFTLDCPSLDPPYRKVKTFAPVECMCRACTDLGKESLQPQELVEALAGESVKIT